jgi:hypothetical protein
MAFRSLAQRLGPAAARCLATESKAAATAAASAEAVLPLKLFGLPARYASALWLAASKAKVLSDVEKELATVTSLASSNAKFGDFLADPSSTKTAKTKGIASILEAGKFSATTKQFFGARSALCSEPRGQRRATAAGRRRAGCQVLTCAFAPRSRAGRERAAARDAPYCGEVRRAHDGVARRGQGRRHLR